METNVLKVSKNSNPNSVAGMLTVMLKKFDEVTLSVVGAGSLNQAVKAIIIAKGFVAPSGYTLWSSPSFFEVEFDGEKRTAIKLIVKQVQG